jgi:hypothetical protein
VIKSRKLHRASLGFAVSAPAVRFRKAAHLSLQAYRAAGRPGGTWRCNAAPDEHSSCWRPIYGRGGCFSVERSASTGMVRGAAWSQRSFKRWLAEFK